MTLFIFASIHHDPDDPQPKTGNEISYTILYPAESMNPTYQQLRLQVSVKKPAITNRRTTEHLHRGGFNSRLPFISPT